MAATLSEADLRMPDLTAAQTTEQKLTALEDYLCVLLELLRWTLRNLSPAENFDQAALDDWVKSLDISARTVVTETLIADELYSRFGAVADLAVSELRTDLQKAQRYLDGDTRALDYLHIHDEEISFLTGTVRSSDGQPETQQLVRGARAFYWTDAQHSQMTCVSETPWPVTVYRYDELTKGTLRFADSADGQGGVTKVPTFILGAGYGAPEDPDAGRGFLRKGAQSLDLWLHGADGADRGVFIGDAFTDIAGLRRTAQLDFSAWDSGSFSETVEGGRRTEFSVDFDADARPVKLTDAGGFETAVIWP